MLSLDSMLPKTVVADQGALYHVGAAQLHAVKVTIEAASTVRGFEYWCYSPGSGAGGGGGQDLGTVAVGLYTNDPAAGVEGPSGLIAQATSPNGRCTPGWNVLEPDEPTDPLLRECLEKCLGDCLVEWESASECLGECLGE